MFPIHHIGNARSNEIKLSTPYSLAQGTLGTIVIQNNTFHAIISIWQNYTMWNSLCKAISIIFEPCATQTYFPENHHTA